MQFAAAEQMSQAQTGVKGHSLALHKRFHCSPKKKKNPEKSKNLLNASYELHSSPVKVFSSMEGKYSEAAHLNFRSQLLRGSTGTMKTQSSKQLFLLFQNG